MKHKVVNNQETEWSGRVDIQLSPEAIKAFAVLVGAGRISRRLKKRGAITEYLEQCLLRDKVKVERQNGNGRR